MKIRVIPTVLVNGTTVVKGELFNNWRTVGHVDSTARLLAARDVDEIFFLDTTATLEKRSINMEFVSSFAETVSIPFGVGGGIHSVDQAKEYIRNGCEKVVLGDAIFDNPGLVQEVANELGSQAVVAAVDVGIDSKIFRRSGKQDTAESLLTFLVSLERLGVGELLIQSIERDGTMRGYDTELISNCARVVNVPILASGGAGKLEDFLDATNAGAAGVCAGAFFQFTEYTPSDVRRYLSIKGVKVRN